MCYCEKQTPNLIPISVGVGINTYVIDKYIRAVLPHATEWKSERRGSYPCILMENAATPCFAANKSTFVMLGEIMN